MISILCSYMSPYISYYIIHVHSDYMFYIHNETTDAITATL